MNVNNLNFATYEQPYKSIMMIILKIQDRSFQYLELIYNLPLTLLNKKCKTVFTESKDNLYYIDFVEFCGKWLSKCNQLFPMYAWGYGIRRQ